MNSDTTVDAKPSASLVLVRNGASGIDVLMMRRNPRLKFAPDALVFPGGAVDDEDSAMAKSDSRLLPLGEFRVAVLRESFEEANILLASRGGMTLTQSDLRGFKRCREYMLDARWLPAGEVSDHLKEGEQIMFPTEMNCQYIAGFNKVDDLLASLGSRTIVPVLPKLEKRGG